MCWQGLFSQSCKLQFCTLFTTCAKPPGSIFANSCRVRSKRPSIKELSHTKFRTCQEVHQGAHIGELEVFVSAKWMMHNRWYYLRKIVAIVRKTELKADLNWTWVGITISTNWKLWTKYSLITCFDKPVMNIDYSWIMMNKSFVLCNE